MQKISASQLIEKAVQLLNDGTVSFVLGWKKGEFAYDTTPALFNDEKSLKEEFVYSDFCGINLSKYLVAKTREIKEGKHNRYGGKGKVQHLNISLRLGNRLLIAGLLYCFTESRVNTKPQGDHRRHTSRHKKILVLGAPSVSNAVNIEMHGHDVRHIGQANQCAHEGR